METITAFATLGFMLDKALRPFFEVQGVSDIALSIAIAHFASNLLTYPRVANMLHLLISLIALFGLVLACPPVTNDTSDANQGYFGPWSVGLLLT